MLYEYGRSGIRILLVSLPLWVLACSSSVDTPLEVVRASIDFHGGDTFESSSIHWTFRDIPYEVHRSDGLFRHQRTVADSLGREVVEVMGNEGIWVEVDGLRSEADQARQDAIVSAVNPTVYLGFLPFKLDDSAVHLADLGSATVEGRLYRRIEATFTEEGGGQGWENRFVFWFRDGEWSLDYLAYDEPGDPRVTRFRRAINRRDVGGIVVQDYENYTDDPETGDIVDYDRRFEEGALRLVSMVEFEEVEVLPYAPPN
jgi:hypothetical protein